ncbi:MAG: squalene--hopene cyclase [Phycisphaerae bacterium]|nr:squalene--hopene cyclase [Phycisphaerae bacterium]
MNIDSHIALKNARDKLLSQFDNNGLCQGELSASALATATAIIALNMYDRDRYQSLIKGGLDWLTANQNADGGFGDTDRSLSNISTTILCYCAFRLDSHYQDNILRIEKWLTDHAGGLDDACLTSAIEKRYGKDRTFAVPIMSMCAIAGIIQGNKPWQAVRQLPFELAVVPNRIFKLLKLPVVSYALPALIAIGIARHKNQPTMNPLVRLIRNITCSRALRKLAKVQPANGGFLEAVPLTAFVAMNLIAAGLTAANGIVDKCIDFITAGIRPDGSWPIDTSLNLWLTTLAVNSLSGDLPAATAKKVKANLLELQYKQVHPYINAEPGGWAWCDSVGGTPDADDTAGSLIALANLIDKDCPDPAEIAAGINGVRWLLGLQNKDGGMPTFCKGSGKLPFDRGGCDLSAHALSAWMLWNQYMPDNISNRIAKATDKALNFLKNNQHRDGYWLALWFGNQFTPDETNPNYGTARVLLALADFRDKSGVNDMIDGSLGWLLANQNSNGSFAGVKGGPGTVEETAVVCQALGKLNDGDDEQIQDALDRGLSWLKTATADGQNFEPSPIGFYFAKLWYYEKLYPLIFSVAAFRQSQDQTWKSEI